MQDRTDPTARWHGIAEQLAAMADSAEQLHREHSPTPAGRCRACTQGGTGLPGAAWPCTLHNLATEALRIRAVRRERGRRSG